MVNVLRLRPTLPFCSKIGAEQVRRCSSKKVRYSVPKTDIGFHQKPPMPLSAMEPTLERYF
jgi:hypothetical protein